MGQPDAIVPAPPSGAPVGVSRAGFGTTELEMRQETAAVAVAERARAEVEARYKLALARPRSVDDARARILGHCRRPRFAAAARYRIPRGGSFIEGPTIRFVESCLQEYGNVLPECTVLYDDDRQRIVRVTVSDLERNVSYSKDVVVRKVMERRRLPKGQVPLGQRTNNEGDLLYILPITEDELLMRQGSLESKAIRTLGQRILPADIIEEAMDAVLATLANQDAQDPAAARKRVQDSFVGLGVYPRQIEEYLGHPLEQASPAQLQELRDLWSAVKEGAVSWADVMAERQGDDGDDKPRKTSKAAKALAEKKKAREAREAAQAKAAESTEPAAEPEPAPAEKRKSTKKAAKKKKAEPKPEPEPEPEDELTEEIIALRQGLDSVFEDPDKLPGYIKRIRALPDGPEKKKLYGLALRAEKELAD